MNDLVEWLLEQLAIDAHRLIDRIGSEYEVKRRIVEVLAAQLDAEVELSHQAAVVPSPAYELLCLLALPHADRPGYRQEWAP